LTNPSASLQFNQQLKEKSMKTCLVTIEAEFNDRIQAGLSALESLWTSDHGLAVRPGGRWCYKSKDYIQATLEVDFGRYDAEGDNYICNLLNCCPGDIIATYFED
tara:strand:- start:1091 stop:1405 length:315 start_codon:yes stop_codon:yes gene_type:complete